MLKIDNEWLCAEFHPRGAAIDRLIYKPLNRNIVRQCKDRTAPAHYTNTIVGPIANRIKHGRFEIDGERFQLDQNEDKHTLHGGRFGLSELAWNVDIIDAHHIQFSIDLPDAHMGFPGPSHFEAKYRLIGATLEVEYRALSPRKNAFNLAPHFYFNLDDQGATDCHLLQISADSYTPVDDALIPTGEITPVDGTAFDFRQPRSFKGLALDHNFCLNEQGFRPVLWLTGTDLEMTLATNQIGMQIYDGRHLGREHIAIEPQGWPNAINEESFPLKTFDKNSWYETRSQFTLNSL